MNVSFLRVIALWGLFSWPLFVAEAQSTIIPDGTIPYNMGVQLKGDTDGPDDLDRVQALGVKWVRRGFIWESIEKEKGVYDFSQYDRFINDCEKRGFRVIGCMAFSNKLYGHVKDEPAREAYARFAARLVEHYKGRNIIWEIWNEPNTMTFWGRHGKVGNSPQYAEEYTNLVRATVPAMKAANPDCVILAGSVSNMWSESYKWMSYCFADGMLDIDWDIWSVHPYGVKAPEDYIEAYSHTRDLMKEAGGNTSRLWINSERGFPLGKAEGYAGGDPALAKEYQAWHIVRQYLVDLLEGLPVTIWYEWGGKEGFALYKDGETSPAYDACKNMVKELSGYKLESRIPLERSRDFALRFVNKEGGVKLVVWTAPELMKSPDTIEPHTVKLSVADGSAELATSDLYGKSGSIKMSGGVIEPLLTGAPLYITLR